MIKFRGWDHDENFMLQHKQLMNIMNSSELGYDIFEDPTYHVMQYVGVNDYQNTEIYVGDVLADRYSKSTGIIFEVIEGEGKFQLLAFKRGFKMHTSAVVDFAPYKYRLIGNIYKNKKLLDIKVID